MTVTPVSATTRSEGDVTFRSRRWVRPEDLNAHGTLFGGSLLRWIDEEAAIYAILQLGIRATSFGRTSLTMRAEVRNMVTRARILAIEKIVFVSVDADGTPIAHGYSEITYDRDRIPSESELPTRAGE